MLLTNEGSADLGFEVALVVVGLVGLVVVGLVVVELLVAVRAGKAMKAGLPANNLNGNTFTIFTEFPTVTEAKTRDWIE